MDEITKLLQNGGSDVMGLINNQSGGAVQIIMLAINVMVPVIFFLVYFFWHLGLDDDRVEDDDDEDAEEGDKSYVLWGKFSIKVLLLMMSLCFLFGWVISFYLGIPVVGAGGTPVKWWWKLSFGMMAVSGAISILLGGLRSTAYQYFNDELHDNREKMQNVCVEFGCGYAPHGSQDVVRGADLELD